MKRMSILIRSLCFGTALLLCLPLLAACNGSDQPADSTEALTDQPGEQVTESAIQEPTEEPSTEVTTETDPPETEQSTEQTTEQPTTEQTTEAPEPELLTALSFSMLPSDLNLSKYFIQPHQCTASLTATEQDGQVLALTTASISDANSSDPYVYFKHAQLAKDLGFESVDTREYPYLVLRVRGQGLAGGIFSFYGYSAKTPSGTGVTGQVDYRLQRTEDWQYLWIDLSKYNKNLPLVRFDMENMALANDEVLYISDMTFFADKEQSQAFMPSKTYPINEQTAEDYTAKIISFNVQVESGSKVRADIRADMLRDLLDQYMPDSIGLQEVTPLWRSMMESFIFNDSYASVGEPRAAGQEATPIYYRVDKYELIDSGTFWLSDTPDVPGSKFETSQYIRICTWAHLRDRVTGKEFVHFNTHLDNLGGGDGRTLRKQQFTVILRFMQRFGDIPKIVTGDFNQAAVNSEKKQYSVYKTMIGVNPFKLEDGTEVYSPFSNARYEAPDNMPEGICATMVASHDPNGTKYNPAKEPIDYVLYSRDSLTALSYKILLFDRGGMYLSDHLPVVCNIKFAPTPTTTD